MAEKKGGGIVLLVVVLVVVLLLAGGGAAYYLGLIPGLDRKAENGGAGPAEPKKSSLFQLEPFTVNLADPGGRRYLRAVINLELDSKEREQEVTNKMVQLRDAIILLLSSRTYDDISTMDGKLRLRNDIVSRCNSILEGQGKVINVYFTDFVTSNQ